jgi:hypothetical protein
LRACEVLVAKLPAAVSHRLPPGVEAGMKKPRTPLHATVYPQTDRAREAVRPLLHWLSNQPGAQSGTCRFCKCTEKNACLVAVPYGPREVIPCHWINPEHTVCSNPACVERYIMEAAREARKAFAFLKRAKFRNVIGRKRRPRNEKAAFAHRHPHSSLNSPEREPRAMSQPEKVLSIDGKNPRYRFRAPRVRVSSHSDLTLLLCAVILALSAFVIGFFIGWALSGARA